MDAEEILKKLDPLYEAMMQEQRDINAGIEHLTKSAKDFISKQYAEEINHLSAAGYKELDSIIYRCAEDLSIKISNTFYHHCEK